jgi:hypothetical protein
VAEGRARRVSWLQVVVGTIGAWFIYALIWLFGRIHRRADIAWIEGPTRAPVLATRPPAIR